MSRTKSGRITDSAIERLASKEGVKALSEPVTRLTFKYHSSRKAGSFYLRHHQGNRDRWVLLGRWPAINTDRARRLMRAASESLFSDPLTPAPLDHFESLGDVLRWYLERSARSADLGASRRAAIKSIITRHLLPSIGGLPLEEVTRMGIDEALISPMREAHRQSYVRAVLIVLMQATRAASSLNMLRSDPFAGWSYKDFSTAKLQPRLPRLTMANLDEFRASLPLPGRTRTLITLMVMWGTRIGETLALRWAWISWGESMLRIPGEVTKTGVPLDIPLTEEAVDVLRRHRKATRKSAFVFPGNKGKSLSESTAHKAIRATSEGTWTAHDLRKLARTMWGELGVEFAISEALLNHQISGLNIIYNAAKMTSKKRAALSLHHAKMRAEGLI